MIERDEKGNTEEQFLKEYNPDKYRKPAVTVDVLIFTIDRGQEKDLRKLPDKKLKILMIKRKNHPFKGRWALPGGFVDMEEDIKDAAVRELLEETGIDAAREGMYMEQLYTWGDVGRDPRMRVISVSYVSLINSQHIQLSPGDDAGDACWFEVKSSIIREDKSYTDNGYILERTVELSLEGQGEELFSRIVITREVRGKNKKTEQRILESSGIAFDHSLIIQYGLERLKNKAQYTDIVFNLMPEYFTLTELQQAYEVILGRKLLKANFRRKIGDMVIETDKVKKDAAHRPAKLYSYNPDGDDPLFD